MNRIIHIAFLFLLSACTFSDNENLIPESFATRYNEAIDQNIRDEIANKNKQLISYISTNNAAEVIKLCSDYLINNDPEGFNGTIELASELIQIPAYTVLAEYHTKTSVAEKEITIKSNRVQQDTNDFALTYTSPNKETYVSLLLSDAGHGIRMVTAIYSKYQSGWKVDYLHFSNYKLYGKTAPEYYYDSKEAKANEDLLGAYTLMLLSNVCNQPAGEIFAYEIQSDLGEYYKDLPNEVKGVLNLPLPADQIATKPLITGIAVVPLAGYQYIPMISYVSQLDLTDEDAIHNECDALNKELDQILPGFSWQFTQILYQAMDKIPADNIEVQSLNMLKKIPSIEQLN